MLHTILCIVLGMMIGLYTMHKYYQYQLDIYETIITMNDDEYEEFIKNIGKKD